jgi:hypothetical protein
VLVNLAKSRSTVSDFHSSDIDGHKIEINKIGTISENTWGNFVVHNHRSIPVHCSAVPALISLPGSGSLHKVRYFRDALGKIFAEMSYDNLTCYSEKWRQRCLDCWQK